MTNVLPFRKKINLRWYQAAPVDEFFSDSTTSILAHMPTGSGKGEVAVETVRRVLDQGKKIVIIVKRIDLVRNISKRLKKYSVPHGILQGKNRTDLKNRVVVCSIDTLIRMDKASRPEADYLLIDEAHDSAAPGYIKVLEDYDCKKFSLTATPYRKEGLLHIADKMLRPVAYMDLVKEGFLVPSRTFSPVKPDLSKVRIQSGDFRARDIYKIYNKKVVYKDIANQYRRYANGLSAVLFASGKALSKKICESLNEDGIPSVHLDESHSLEEREDAIRQLESGQIRIICNINVLSTGVDIPSLQAVIMCRPTLSRSVYMQQAGRGSRPHKNKKDFILLDLAGNSERFGLIEYAPDGNLEPLDDNEKEKEISDEPSPFECPECAHFFMPAGPLQCPECGWVKEPEAPEAQEVSIVTDELNLEEIDREAEQEKQIRKFATEAELLGKKPGSLYYAVEGRFGSDIAKKYCPYHLIDRFYEIYSDLPRNFNIGDCY